jgi:hypothetical protein
MNLTELMQDLILEAPFETAIAFVLAMAFLVLVGSMLMPLLAYSAAHLVRAGLATARRIAHWVVDKVIETVIVGVLTFFGWLWILDALPGWVK